MAELFLYFHKTHLLIDSGTLTIKYDLNKNYQKR